ncbi:MAG: cytidine deaminase [Planctomycetes bacterium]|nr:cytidine deaminase [Planctomycetota bacterium]
MTNAEELLQAAQDVAAHSHSPYSEYRVGAALCTLDGQVFVGANVENKSYGLTICAERSAVTTAVASGILRASGAGQPWIVAIAVWVDDEQLAMPCGACLQVLQEFSDPETRVELGCAGGEQRSLSFKDLLPQPF